MRCELPVLSRFCFCFPLRHGLLVWAYLKQIFNIAFLTITITKSIESYGRLGVANDLLDILVILYLIADIAFQFFFIISAHKKDYRKIRIFYRYSVFVLCLYLVFCLISIGNIIYYTYLIPYLITLFWWMLLPHIILTLLCFFVQGYLIVLVKSEFMKLKNNSQFEFVNNADEQKCTANLDLVEDIPLSV